MELLATVAHIRGVGQLRADRLSELRADEIAFLRIAETPLGIGVVAHDPGAGVVMRADAVGASVVAVGSDPAAVYLPQDRRFRSSSVSCDLGRRPVEAQQEFDAYPAVFVHVRCHDGFPFLSCACTVCADGEWKSIALHSVLRGDVFAKVNAHPSPERGV